MFSRTTVTLSPTARVIIRWYLRGGEEEGEGRVEGGGRGEEGDGIGGRVENE